MPHEILEAGAQERDGGAARKSTSYHQETEANQFAIELLAPERMVSRYLRGLPELEQVVAMHTKLDISNTAAARRNVKLHKEPLAVVFATDGAFQYADREADPLDWGLRNVIGLSAQSFYQQGGHQIVLLHLDADPAGQA